MYSIILYCNKIAVEFTHVGLLCFPNYMYIHVCRNLTFVAEFVSKALRAPSIVFRVVWRLM